MGLISESLRYAQKLSAGVAYNRMYSFCLPVDGSVAGGRVGLISGSLPYAQKLSGGL